MLVSVLGRLLGHVLVQVGQQSARVVDRIKEYGQQLLHGHDCRTTRAVVQNPSIEHLTIVTSKPSASNIPAIAVSPFANAHIQPTIQATAKIPQTVSIKLNFTAGVGQSLGNSQLGNRTLRQVARHRLQLGGVFSTGEPSNLAKLVFSMMSRHIKMLTACSTVRSKLSTLTFLAKTLDFAVDNFGPYNRRLVGGRRTSCVAYNRTRWNGFGKRKAGALTPTFQKDSFKSS